jgi:hypothetical protein
MSAKQKVIKPGAAQMLDVDIEQEIPEPLVVSTENTPHDSAEAYSQIIGKHTEAVFPLLDTKEKGKSGALVLALLVGISIFAGWGVAYEVQYQLTPHVPGICVPPAVIENGGCFNVETSTGANGATVTTLVPAGQLRP